MLFNSWSFALFFLIVVSLYHVSRWRIQNILLLVASYVFYSFWDWRFTALLAGSTLVDYFIAIRMESAVTQPARRRLMFASICANLGTLGFFKYYDFFTESAVSALNSMGVNANVPLLNVVLPVGISFYTFQTLAYTIDVYRGQQKPERDFITYALYVCYFPQLVAGPIERATRLLPQLRAPRHVTQNDWNEGAQLILWGFVKKVAVADSLARFVNEAYADPSAQSTPFLWLAMYCFGLQIYCDFSGYTDIARGTSRLFGIRLMENFRQPYFSASITEFWRRWHISLSTWLRDYLYVPLGGNRHGELKRYRNLMLTMLIGGLWHGAAWTFVLWGGIHGLLLAVHRFLRSQSQLKDDSNANGLSDRLIYFFKIFATFHIVILAWIPFRAESWQGMLDYIEGLLLGQVAHTFNDLVSTGIVDNLIFYGLLVALIDLLCWTKGRELPMSMSQHWLIRSVVYAGGLLVLVFVRGGSGEPFIYFQF